MSEPSDLRPRLLGPSASPSPLAAQEDCAAFATTWPSAAPMPALAHIESMPTPQRRRRRTLSGMWIGSDADTRMSPSKGSERAPLVHAPPPNPAPRSWKRHRSTGTVWPDDTAAAAAAFDPSDEKSADHDFCSPAAGILAQPCECSLKAAERKRERMKRVARKFRDKCRLSQHHRSESSDECQPPRILATPSLLHEQGEVPIYAGVPTAGRRCSSVCRG